MKIINLLPPSEIDLIRSERMFNTVRTATVFSFLSYFLVIFLLVGARFYLQSSIRSLDSQIKQANDIISKQDNSALRKQVDADNAIVRDYQALQAANPRWSKVMIGLAQLVPPDVGITSISANTKTGEIDIAGKANTRDSVLQLRANIAASPLFQKIDLPLENLQKPTDVSYHYKFFLQDNVLLQSK